MQERTPLQTLLFILQSAAMLGVHHTLTPEDARLLVEALQKDLPRG